MPFICAACFVVAVSIIALSVCRYKTDIINWGIFVATVSLATVAYVQLKALRQQATADFLLKFNRDFFGSNINQQIIIAIEEKKKLLKANRGKFTEYELDDYLGYYELMAQYEKKGLLDFELIDEMFGHYIVLAWKNREVKKYIKELRKETNDPRYYEPFQHLAMRLIDKEKEIRQ